MNKLISASIIGAAFLASIAPGVVAKSEKVEVCHIIEANDVIPFGPAPVMLHFGKVIDVSENAVPAHLGRSDSASFFTNQMAIEVFKSVGFHLPAADCYYGVMPNGDTLPQPDPEPTPEPTATPTPEPPGGGF